MGVLVMDTSGCSWFRVGLGRLRDGMVESAGCFQVACGDGCCAAASSIAKRLARLG